MCFTINLSKTAYPAAKQTKVVGKFHDYLINKGMYGTLNHGMLTENINTCCAGVINSGKTNFMFHAAPELQPNFTIKDDLARAVDFLRESCDNVKAFICGGCELSNKPHANSSFDLYNTIADTLDDLGVKFTMMCGKKEGAPMEGLYAVNENTTVWSDAFKDLFKGKGKISTEEMLDKLSEKYQFVESNAENVLNLK